MCRPTIAEFEHRSTKRTLQNQQAKNSLKKDDPDNPLTHVFKMSSATSLIMSTLVGNSFNFNQ